MNGKLWLYAFLSVFVAFLDDFPIGGDAVLFRGFRSFGDLFPELQSWYYAHAVLIGFSTLFLVLAVREARRLGRRESVRNLQPETGYRQCSHL